MERPLGIATEDFRLYHDLVAALKERGLRFRTLRLGAKVPEGIGAVLTSSEETSRIEFPRVVACNDVEDAIARARQVSRGMDHWRELVIGVDPGPRPGVAVLGDGEVLDRRWARDPEDVIRLVRGATANFTATRIRVRVGNGDPTNRNRILNALSFEGHYTEIVDEKGTTKRTPQPDLDAAVEIAMARGVRAAPRYDVEPTPGEVKEIQRRSRLGSEGAVTIPKDLARDVARGRLSLGQAVDRARRRTPPEGENEGI